MNFAKTSYAGTIEILASNDYQAIPAKIAVAQGATSTIVKAGTPIDSSGLASESDSPVLRCERRKCNHRRKGCALVYARQPAQEYRHGTAGCVSVFRYCL